MFFLNQTGLKLAKRLGTDVQSRWLRKLCSTENQEKNVVNQMLACSSLE